MRAVYEGLDDIMSFYDTANADGEYGFSVWFNLRDIAFQCNKEDPTGARTYLEDNLTALQQAGSKDLFYIKFHPREKGYITKKTPIISVTPVRVNPLIGDEVLSGVPERNPTYWGTNGGGAMYKIQAAMEGLPDKFDTIITSKLSPLELRIAALETPKEPEKDFLSQISGLAQNEELVKGFFGLLNNLIKPQTAPAYPAINGVPEPFVKNEPIMEQQQAPPQPAQETNEPVTEHIVDNVKMDAALDRLNAVMLLDDDLTALADYAEKNPEQFTMFLGILRKS